MGEGGALSIATCTRSFDSLSACDVTDTTFSGNTAAKKGGAVTVGSGTVGTTIEFHRCLIASSTTGKAIEDDPQGEGGAFSLGQGTHLMSEDCIVKNNACGKKVWFAREYASFSRYFTFLVAL